MLSRGRATGGQDRGHTKHLVEGAALPGALAADDHRDPGPAEVGVNPFSDVRT